MLPILSVRVPTDRRGRVPAERPPVQLAIRGDIRQPSRLASDQPGSGGRDRMSGFETFEVANVLLQKGGTLPTARLAYATRGELNAARDNAVLVPSWYTGTHDGSEAFMLGEQRALDPSRYFIILTNLLANGLSSSPSNSSPPVERGRFPKVTIHDNVRLQHRLVTEKLGLEK